MTVLDEQPQVQLPGRVAVVGAGTMGAGIAVSFALGGCPVRLSARTERTLESARERIPEIARTLARDPADAFSAISLTTSTVDALADAELVVETITEEIEPKRELFALAERVAAPDAILATNTSSLPLSDLASALERPERLAGLHWFNPPELVELVEVVASSQTEPGVTEKLAAWVLRLGKVPVVLRRETPGFLANRLQYALLREAWALVESGVASFEDIDRALVHGLGARWAVIGPFQTLDLAGLDVHLAVARNLFPELSRATEAPAMLEGLVADGALGCKNGLGLLGVYGPEAVTEIVARRRRVLAGLRKIRSNGEAT
jgi:3-hydroxybutyryl-CoA dehydrogenase